MASRYVELETYTMPMEIFEYPFHQHLGGPTRIDLDAVERVAFDGGDTALVSFKPNPVFPMGVTVRLSVEFARFLEGCLWAFRQSQIRLRLQQQETQQSFGNTD